MRREPEGNTALTKQRLLNAARHEFAVKGYEKASLRGICASAELTTGALYFFFEGKDDLFNSTVQPLMAEVMQLMEGEYEPGVAEQIVNLYYDNQEAAEIILSNREHPTITKFFDELADCITAQTKQRIAGEAASDYIVHWLSHLQMDTVMHVFAHELPRKEAVEQLNHMMRFLSGGMTSLAG